MGLVDDKYAAGASNAGQMSMHNVRLRMARARFDLFEAHLTLGGKGWTLHGHA